MFTLDILYLNVNKYKVDRMETHCIQHFNNTSNTCCNNFKGNPLIKYKKILIYEKEQNHMTHACLICITNLQASWVHSKFVQTLLFYMFVLFKHECCALFKHGHHVHDFSV